MVVGDIEDYLSLCLALCFFVSLSMHLVIHYRDGVNIMRDTSHRSRVLKVSLCLLHFTAYFLLLMVATDQVPGTISVLLWTVVWVESAAIVEFDYRRWLAASWLQQRGLWSVSCLWHIFQLLNPASSKLHYFLAVLSTILCLLALFKPNDYILLNQTQEMMENLLVHPIPRTKTTSSSSLAESQLSVSLNVCKVKRFPSTTQLDYRFSINVSGTEHQLKVSSADFERFDHKMSEKFRSMYPLLDFPRLPKPNNSDIDVHSKQIEDYLAALCRPDYRCSELFDFLQLSSEDRDLLSTPLVRFLDLYECVSLSRSSSEGNGERLLVGDESIAVFVRCHVEGWMKIDAQKPYIVYRVKWTTVDTCYSGLVAKRFSDFYQLHRTIKSRIGSAKMPDFPSKNYLQSFIGELDSHALDLRRKALEGYINYVLNDPAYLCSPLLEFLNCPVGVETLWRTRVSPEPIRLMSRVNWTSEMNGDGSCYFCYSVVIGQEDNQWHIVHRYSEFDELHQALEKRKSSDLLKAYMAHREVVGVTGECLPMLPKKTLTAISTVEEIEARRDGLERYLSELFSTPLIQDSYAFRAFIRGISTSSPSGL